MRKYEYEQCSDPTGSAFCRQRHQDLFSALIGGSLKDMPKYKRYAELTLQILRWCIEGGAGTRAASISARPF